MGPRSTMLAAVLATAALLAAGCGAEEPEQPAAPPAETELPEADPPEPAPESAARSNPEAGYAVEYPAGWHANEDAPAEPCSLFHPEPFDTEAVEPPSVAIHLAHEPVPYEEATRDGASREVTAIGDAVVAGRPATRLAYRGTGEEALPEGTRGYAVVVDLGDGTTLIGATHENGHDFEESSEVLDALMDSLLLER